MLKLRDKSGKRWAVTAILLLGGALLLNGCDSDPVAPHDETPALSEQDVAQQSGVVAAALAKVSPEIIRFRPTEANKVLGVYPYDFPDTPQVTGMVTLEFFTGGPTGSHVAYGDADYGMLYTAPDSMLHVEIEYVTDAFIRFDLGLRAEGYLDQEAGSAVVSGSGTFVSGQHPGDFQFTGLAVSNNGKYPTAGTLMFTSASWTMNVVFDGDETADIRLDGVLIYVVDLETGLITAVTGP